ncbi:MAG: AI-2E family transporter [Minisyncoccia bacterium]
MFTQEKIQIPFFLGLFGVVLFLSLLVFLPYLNVIILAIVLSIALYPIYTFCLKIFGDREKLSAVIAVTIVILAILLPAILVGFYLFGEIKSLYSHINFDQGLIIDFLKNKLHISDDLLDVNSFNNFIQQILGWVSSNINSIFSNAINSLINLFILVFSMFFLFKDGKYVIKKLVILSPLKNEHDEMILQKISVAINSITRGYFIIALIQGSLIGLAFSLFNVPNPVLWSLIAAVTSFIPVLGTSIVVIPALIYLLFYGTLPAFIGLAICYFLFISLVDNLLIPILLKRGMKINSVIILLSVLGGLSFFGPIGLLTGPLAVSTLFALIEIYPLIIKKEIKTS